MTSSKITAWMSVAKQAGALQQQQHLDADERAQDKDFVLGAFVGVEVLLMLQSAGLLETLPSSHNDAARHRHFLRHDDQRPWRR